MIHEALILAGGFGTRLGEAAQHLAKPMVEVGGRPFLAWILDQLAEKKIGKVLLSVGYRAHQVIGHFGTRWGAMELVYEEERSPRGTGGAVQAALKRLDGEYVLTVNGDSFVEFDLAMIEAAARESRNPVVVAVGVEDTARFGRLEIQRGRVTRFVEKGISGAGYINAGVYALPVACMDGITAPMPFSLETALLEPFALAGRLQAVVTGGRFIDIGVPEDLARAREGFFDR
ncbi:MAG: NTP transferase domain-containing protein [Nitrospinae bacterium]|nr:NTP transferase domain-containing protein [Nitrospinota bacterium]